MTDFHAFSAAAPSRDPSSIETMMKLALGARHPTLRKWAAHWLHVHCRVQIATHREAA